MLTKREQKLIEEFQKYCRQRLLVGKEKYKTKDFSQLDLNKIKKNIQEEIVDLSNWLFILWCNMKK